MKRKILFLFFIFLLFNFFSYGIDEKLYKNLTDRDRILLAISYYEVGKKYEALGKTDLAKSYLNAAFKIEKNVDKYAKGELQIPPKKIKIEWDKIFEEENKEIEKDNKSLSNQKQEDKTTLKEREGTSLSYEESIKKLVNDFFKYLNSYDSVSASNLFTDEVLIQQVDIYITRYEIKESFEGFFSLNYNKKYQIDSIKVEKIDDLSFIVKIKLSNDDSFFIFPTENREIKLGVVKENNKYLFNKIFGNFKETTENKNYETPDKILTEFVSCVIEKRYQKASFFFNEEVWFEEFKVILTKDTIMSNFVFFGTFSNLKISDIIDLNSIKEIEIDTTPFAKGGIKFSGYRAFIAKFFIKEILPSNPKKDNFIFVFDKKDRDYKIVGIAQE